MNLPLRVVARWWRRRSRLAGRDRGDSPVPSAVIIAGLVVVALFVLAWLFTYVQGFMDAAPTDLPEPPGSG